MAKFIRFEAGWKLMWDEVRNTSISITKFTKYRWNDVVFEGSKKHRRCSGKCTGFSVYVCRKELILLQRDSSLCYASFRMTRFCFLLTIRNLNYFWNAKIFFILIMFLREQSWRNSFALKRGGKSAYFLSQSSRRIGEIIVFLRTLRNIGDVLGSAQVFSLCV